MDIGAQIYKMMRVLRVATRPTQKEFYSMAKVVLAGTALIGFIGVVIAWAFSAFANL